MQRTAENISDAEAAELKLVWEGQGATVVVTSNGDGTSNVTGTWPDSSARNS